MRIRKIKKTEWRKIRAFNKSQYGAGHILCDKVYYDWQFDNVFNSSQKNYAALGLFDKKDNIVGTIGLFRAPLNLFGRKADCVWLANLIVKEELRSVGYGYLLLKEGVAGCDIGVDHNINKNARPVFLAAGWRGKDVSRYLCVLDKKKSERLMNKNNLRIKTFDELVKKSGKKTDLNFKEVNKIDRKFEDFWRKIKTKYPVSVERSSRYLNWRYLRHPMVDYRVFAAEKSNNLEAFLVLRIEEATEGKKRKRTGIRLGRIVDFVSLDGAEEFTLFKAVEFCRSQKLAFVDFFLTGDFYASAFRKAGFISDKKKPYSLIPTLFNPIDRIKRTRNNFAFKLVSKKLFNRKIDNFKFWYLTKGDGDQDRPY